MVHQEPGQSRASRLGCPVPKSLQVLPQRAAPGPGQPPEVPVHTEMSEGPLSPASVSNLQPSTGWRAAGRKFLAQHDGCG